MAPVPAGNRVNLLELLKVLEVNHLALQNFIKL